MDINLERKGTEERFYALASDVVHTAGLELYDVEYNSVNGLLRVYIFNKETETATINECADVDRAFTPHVENGEWMPEKLTLEVSSPGVYRKIKTLAHFKMSLGKLIKVHFGSNVELDTIKNKKVIVTLDDCNESFIKIKLDKTEEEIQVEYTSIKSVNAEFTF